MTPKFRIYDKTTSSYIPQSSSRFLISSSGRLYDAIKFEWHEIGVRYEVEMALDVFELSGTKIYEGDVLKTNESGWIGFVKYNHSSHIIMDSSGGYSTYPDFRSCKIIGTIHDEKYKNL